MTQQRANKVIMKIADHRWVGIWQAVFTVLLFCSIFFAAESALSANSAYGMAVLPGVAVAVLYVLFAQKTRGKLFLLLGAGVFSVVMAVITPVQFAGSIVKMINAVIESSNDTMHYGIGYLQSMSTTWFSDFAVVSIISVWLAVLVVTVSKRVSLLLGATIAYCLVLLCVGLFPSPVAILTLVVAITGQIVGDSSATLKTAMAIMMVLVFGLLAVSGCFVYKQSAVVTNTRESINDAFSSMAYGTDSLPQGRLMRAQNILSDQDRLVITISEQTPSLYLKGFVGSQLEGNVWQETDKNSYVTPESQGLIPMLAQYGIPFTQQAQYLKFLGKSTQYSVEVENVGANSKYIYAPYSLTEYPSSAYNYDMNIYRGVTKSKSYSYQVVQADTSSERVLQASWVSNPNSGPAERQQFLDLDGKYRRFVYSTYTQIDEDQKQIILDTLVNDQGKKSVFSVSRLIRLWYMENFTFTKTADKIRTDFFTDFFDGTIQNANAVYYATAATLIFRAYGYPARYVEGYMVRAGISERTSVVVTGKNSHAWTEVYFDGIGWLPIEVTPTYFTEEDLEETTIPDTPSQGAVAPNVEPKPVETQPEKPIERPDPTEDPTLTPDQRYLYKTLRIVVPIAGVALVVIIAVLFLALRRQSVLARKRRRLKLNGERFGRAAMKLLDSECKLIGGYTQKKATQMGMPPEQTERFINLVERTVYGGYNLSIWEINYVIKYIGQMANIVSNSRGKFYRFYCRYFQCLGI